MPYSVARVRSCPAKVLGAVSREQRGKLCIDSGGRPAGRDVDDTRLMLGKGADQRSKIAPIEGHDDTSLGYRELIDVRIGDLALPDLIPDVFHVEVLVQSLEHQPGWHILIEKQLVFEEAFRHC